jgi:hypothetical protein
MNSEEGFSVKSAYDLLVEFGDSPNFGPYERMILSKIWESSAPSKIVVFSWHLFHNRLPTKDNLLRRGVLDQEVVVIVFGVILLRSRQSIYLPIVGLPIGCGTRFSNG